MARPLRRVSIHDVARSAGVSAATVSKVINGRDGVARATSQRVQDAVDELGYEASLVARSLRSTRTNVIGVLVMAFEPFSTEILKGVSHAIEGTGFELLAYSAGGRADDDLVGWERRYLSRLSGTLIDGAILVTPTVVDPGGSIPVVAIDTHVGPTEMPRVDSDNLAGAVTATEHLLSLGHRRIGFLGGRPDLESSRLREEGFRRTLAAAGIAPDADLMRVGSYSRELAHGPARELLTLEHPPTAVFAANDLSAIATIEVAGELGLVVPDDLSVIGFDNVPESALTAPALTTVSHPIQRMGAEALHLLVRLIDDPSASPTQVRLPTQLLERGSTGPPTTRRRPL